MKLFASVLPGCGLVQKTRKGAVWTIHARLDICLLTCTSNFLAAQGPMNTILLPGWIYRTKPRRIDHQRIELQEPLPPRAVCFVKRKGHPLSVAARELEKMIVEFGKEG